MNQHDINEIVKQVNDSDIASVKNVITGIARLLSDPNSSIIDIKEIFLIDPPLMSKVLKLANSSYYAPANPIEEIDKALIIIGFDAVLELALNQKACEMFDNDKKTCNYSAFDLWENNVAVALFGKYMFRREFTDSGESAYIAGLLHNIGIIALDQFLHNEFTDIVKEAENLKQDFFEVEKNRLGFTHTQLGKAIIADWNLPGNISSAIEWHHDPLNSPKEYSKIVNTLYVADYFCAHKKIGYSDAPHQDQELFMNIVQQLNVTPESFKLIGKDVENEIAKMKETGLL
jgi:HD-like signal output (HDOD) protein